MRLASLTLQGFKSFGNRTSIEFAPGVTAIIGPNGSGKSNVIDALKWTSGGGRAREFRASDKTDLIFHGAAGKRSVGLAEVEVELVDAGAGVKLYRSLDREGTTRLRLNGRAARFLDVEEALAGSGLGRSGLAIIGQGEVSQVLIADPAKLLEYVAEAAGVARLSGRRDQTQARLETALSHLDRLRDVLLGLAARCQELEEEAHDAQKHAQLSAEALILRFTAASARQAALKSEISGLEQRRGLLEAALLEGQERLAGVRQQGLAANQARDEAEEKYRAASAELEFRRGNFRLATERLERLQERAASHEAGANAVAAEIRQLEGLQPPTQPELAPGTAAEAASEARETALVARTALAGAAAGEASARALLTQAQEALAAAERSAAAAASHRAALAEQQQQVEERLLSLQGEGQGLDLSDLESRALQAQAAANDAESGLETGRATLQQLHERHAQARAEAGARRRAAERQRAAFEARRGYAQGPRNALAAGIKGVIGSVADLVRVTERYQEAIAGALGRRAEYVVADNAETAHRVLQHVRQAGGFVTVLPLDLLRPGSGRGLGALTGQQGVVAAATDVIEVDDRYAALFEQLLGGTALVQDMPAATALARRFDQRPRMVTLSGDVLEASGAMSGGKRAQQHTVLGAAADLEEAEAATSQATALAAHAEAELAAQQATVLRLIETGRQAAAARAVAESELAKAREKHAGNSRLLTDLQERAARLQKEADELEQQEAPDEAGLLELRQEAEVAAAGHAGALRELEAARAAESDARLAAAAGQQASDMALERWRAFQEARNRFQDSHERAAQLKHELAGLAARGHELSRQVTEAMAARDLAASAVPQGLSAEEESLADARAALKKVEADLTVETAAQAARAQELEEVKVQAARRETALELAEEELSAFPEGLAANELSERAARARLRSVEEELAGLGPVNHRAATDLQETRERKEALDAEAVQATLAVTELESTLERIDRETSDRLGGALGRLKESFARHVRQLFGDDGRGGIEVDMEGARPVGLRILLQPPGKQTHSLHLLSVGERTMGALAFLFALMGHGAGGAGLPVAVLDEVDAPLDEANIRRFSAFVSRLAAAGTQFVLITHQKATFEVADTLWGVTTEQGVSRVFSIKREETRDSAVVGT